MLDHVLVEENIVHLGAFLYLAGFLCRDQLLLRGFIVAGDVVYILYFYLAPASPLWGGIFWSVVFTLANLAMIGRILSDRSAYGMTEDDRRLHGLLDTLTPGEFRRLMRAGHWNKADGDVAITLEGQPLHRLAYVIDGTITVEKAGHSLHDRAADLHRRGRLPHRPARLGDRDALGRRPLRDVGHGAAPPGAAPVAGAPHRPRRGLQPRHGGEGGAGVSLRTPP